MRPQVLVKSEVIAPQAITQIGFLDQTEQAGYSESPIANSTILIIRWVSILYCLTFWYGMYRIIQFLVP